jgi:hypothetical protein
MGTRAVITAAVEGLADEVVVRRLIEHVGASTGAVYGRQGKDGLRKRTRGYDAAGRHAPWLVLVDLDRDAECAPALRRQWLSDLAPHVCLRIAVRSVEAWLLADSERLASFLAVSVRRIPAAPDRLDDPKAELVSLARSSRRQAVRHDMVPRPESGRRVGAAYTSRLIEFASGLWRPEAASLRSDSLGRAIGRMRQLAESVR